MMTEDLKITRLQLENVYDLRDWQDYDNPLFSDYNFPELDDYEVGEWFKSRTENTTSLCFAVLNGDDMTIGLINIKNIKKIMKTASLGIVFNPKFINKGYGTKSLKLVIKYFFENMNMRILYLDVEKHNKRAMRCYEKCGFEIAEKYTMRSKYMNLKEINNFEEDFIVQNGVIHAYCYKMRINRKKYFKIKRENI